MFTGLIQALGSLQSKVAVGGDVRLQISTPSGFLAESKAGDSIAVCGVCLTALELQPQSFCADVSLETLRLTTLGQLAEGAPVNLELSLRPQDRLGGHFVTGHVDAVGRVLAIEEQARAQRWDFAVPVSLAAMIAQKGSVAVEGVSLTVNGVDTLNAEEFCFWVTLIPHTLGATNLGKLVRTSAVNIEVDLLARYLARQLALSK